MGLESGMSNSLNEQCVRCSCCGKRVSQYVNVQGEPTDLLVRAWVECPECVQKRPEMEENEKSLKQ